MKSQWVISDAMFMNIAVFYGFAFLIYCFNESNFYGYVIVVLLVSCFMMFLNQRRKKE